MAVRYLYGRINRWISKSMTSAVQNPPIAFPSLVKVQVLINFAIWRWNADIVRAPHFIDSNAAAILLIPLSMLNSEDKHIWQ